jgi:hypothetical protein
LKLVALLAAATLGLTGVGAAPPANPHGPIGWYDWPSYGHDAQHTFYSRTTLTPASTSSLARAWFFPTGLAVTATPTVVGGARLCRVVGRQLLCA